MSCTQINEYKKNIISLEKEIQLIEEQNNSKLNNNIEVKLNESEKRINNIKGKIADLLMRVANHKVKLDELEQQNSTIDHKSSLYESFQQYLIDKRKEQAYAIADGDEKLASNLSNWFERLEKTFIELFEEPNLRLRHNLKNSSFYFEIGDDQKFNFNELADGYGSVMYILSEIFLQMEVYNQVNGISNGMSGIVLIDEIESHLHLSLQEKIMPALTNLFPMLQFIVCSHSPQVISSIRNCNVYDLTSNELVTDFMGGYSYDVISKEHFGISSEYSIEATKLLDQAKNLVNKDGKSSDDINEAKRIMRLLEAISPELTNELFIYINSIGDDKHK